MLSRLHTSLLSSLILVGAACGDDKGGSATDATTSSSSSSTTSSSTDTPTSSGTTGMPTTGTTAEPTTGPDPTTSTSTTDPSTTTGMGGCAAPADEADEDGDGVANNKDNCRCDPNPNQLDFDANSVGNVCDAPLTFTIADGVPPEFNRLDTSAKATSTLSCTFPVSLVVLSGDVQVTLDDEGSGKIYAAQINFADTPELECDLVLVNVKLIIEMLVGTGVEPFTVGFPFTIPDHEGGMVTGMMDAVHNLTIDAIINVTESSNPDLAPTGENPLMDVPSSFPAGVVTVVKDAQQLTIDFNDPNHIVLEQTTMSGIEIVLTGLTGKLRLKY